MKPEKMREMSLMLDFYGALLSDRQKDICEQYFSDDLSLSEIAENTGITRQGVRDGVKKAEAILEKAEEQLGLYAAWLQRRRQIAALQVRLAELGVDDPAVDALLDTLQNC